MSDAFTNLVLSSTKNGPRNAWWYALRQLS